MMDNEVNRQAFFDVITAIDSANDKELLALARVEKAINKIIANNVINPTAGATSKQSGAGDFTPVSSVAGRRKKREKDKAEGRSRSTSTQSTASESNTRTRRTRNASNTEQAAIPEPVTPTVEIPAEITATATTQQTPAEIAATSTSQQTPAEIAATSEQENHNEEAEKQQRETNELLAGLYEDSQGRLRQASGAFASRQQNEALTASQAPSEDEGSQSLLKSLSTWAADKGKSVAGNDAADSAGVAVGSSLWLATKEIGQMTTSAVELATANKLTSMAGIKERASQAKNALKNPKAALLSLFGRGDGPQTDDPQTSSTVDRTVSAVPANSEGSTGAVVEQSPVAENGDTTTDSTLSQSSVDRSADTSAERLSESADEQTEVLADQNETQIALLEQIETAIASAGGAGGGSLLGGAGPGRRSRRGRRRGRGRLGRLGGRLGGRMGGVLATGGTMAAGAASGASKVAGGAKFLAKGAAKMVPFLAPLMAGYDAVSGFNDDERQKEVFNLKEGEEASTGQKSAMAMGNMLDMGGLVSGGAGLLGSLMGGMGFDGAQEALTFDTDSMTKGIYSMFGGDTPGDKESDKTSQVDQANQDADKKAQGETPIVTSASPGKNKGAGTEQTGPTNNQATASSDYTAPAIKPPQSGTATPPINVTAQSDPALTKVMTELLKETKDNNRKANDKSGSGNKTYNKYTSNVTAQNKSGDAGIPIGPSNPQLQLIALDAN
jgi:hypothetical protein